MILNLRVTPGYRVESLPRRSAGAIARCVYRRLATLVFHNRSGLPSSLREDLTPARRMIAKER